MRGEVAHGVGARRKSVRYRPLPKVDHLALLKPRVMALVVFTGAVGYVLAPGSVDLAHLALTLTAMAGGAGACGALNMWWDADIDAQMSRTASRPIPRGAVAPQEALIIGVLLSLASVAMMGIEINLLAAALLALTIAIYVPFYTMLLKRQTPYNIVYGGAAGALPPVIGWAAASGGSGVGPLALLLIIFLWTPPHFWSLALRKSGDYARVGVPMLPNVAGPVRTCQEILVYGWLLVGASFTPLVIPHLGLPYAGVALVLDVLLMRRVLHLYALRNGPEAEQRSVALGVFGFSIVYMFALFATMLMLAVIA